MKKRQRCVTTSTTPIIPLQSNSSKSNVDLFLQNYINCKLLYQTMLPSHCNAKLPQKPQSIQLFKHAFVNIHQHQQLPHPSLSMNTTRLKQTNNKTLFDTFNYSDFTHNNEEEEEYSNYLKEYETLVKASRKKDIPSPQPQTQQMKELINQFLSDIPSQSSQEDKAQSKTGISRKQTTKVEKIQIDLNAFQINKQNKKSPAKINKQQSLDKRKKQGTPRFINANDLMAKAKKNQQGRQKKDKSNDKKQIQVIRVTNLTQRTSVNLFQKHLEKVVIAKNVQKPPKAPQQKEINTKKQESPRYSNSSFTYSKNKSTRHKGNDAQLAKQEKRQQRTDPSKKPLKIEIQIPLQQLSPSPKTLIQDQKLQHQRRQIIKQVAERVMAMLKTSDIATIPKGK